MQRKASEEHLISYGTYVLVWLSLISLTALTVAAAGIDFAKYALLIALLIAAIKSTLVISYFMHIKFDDLIFKVFLLVAFLTLASIFILTAFDIFYR